MKTERETTTAPATPRQRWPFPKAFIGVGSGIGIFVFLSALSRYPRRAFHLGRHTAPPVYGRFDPRFAIIGLVAIALAMCAVLAARSFGKRDIVRARVLLPIAVLFLVSFAGAVAMIDGSPTRAISPIQRLEPPDYSVDLSMIRAHGVRDGVVHFPNRVAGAKSVHTKTHPPGALLLLDLLENVFPNHVVPRAIAICFLGALILLAAYALARRIAGERAAMVAVLLLAVAPAPVMFGFLSLDTVFSAALAGSAALMVWAFKRGGSLRMAVLAGFVLGMTSLLTYAVAFVLVFGVIYAIGSRGVRGSIRPLLAAAAGGIAALGFLRLALGFDLISCYRASLHAIAAYHSSRPYFYWLLGSPIAWLMFAGLPIAALSLRELKTRRPLYMLAQLTPLVLFYLLPEAITHIIPGETERTLMFGYPIAAAAAGAAFVRWEKQRGSPAATMLALLVAMTAAQTILFESIYTLPW